VDAPSIRGRRRGATTGDGTAAGDAERATGSAKRRPIEADLARPVETDVARPVAVEVEWPVVVGAVGWETGGGTTRRGRGDACCERRGAGTSAATAAVLIGSSKTSVGARSAVLIPVYRLPPTVSLRSPPHRPGLFWRPPHPTDPNTCSIERLYE